MYHAQHLHLPSRLLMPTQTYTKLCKITQSKQFKINFDVLFVGFVRLICSHKSFNWIEKSLVDVDVSEKCTWFRPSQTGRLRNEECQNTLNGNTPSSCTFQLNKLEFNDVNLNLFTYFSAHFFASPSFERTECERKMVQEIPKITRRRRSRLDAEWSHRRQHVHNHVHSFTQIEVNSKRFGELSQTIKQSTIQVYDRSYPSMMTYIWGYFGTTGFWSLAFVRAECTAAYFYSIYSFRAIDLVGQFSRAPCVRWRNLFLDFVCCR